MKKKGKRILCGAVAAAMLTAAACFIPVVALAELRSRVERNPVSITKTIREKRNTTDSAHISEVQLEKRVPSEGLRTFVRNNNTDGLRTTTVEVHHAEDGLPDKEAEQASFASPHAAEPENAANDAVSFQPINVKLRIINRKTVFVERTGVSSQPTGVAKEKAVQVPTEPTVVADPSPEDFQAHSSPATVNTENKGIQENKTPSIQDGQPKSPAYDDSTCLVALGYQLNPDGSMQPELIGRLQTLLNAAEQHPNSLIVCTGGPTASNNPNVSEGGQMAKWLISNGVDPNRILVEGQAMTTQGNAANTLAMLARTSPQVNNIVVVTSNYHMFDSVTSFQSQAIQMGSGIIVSAGDAYQAR